MKALTHNGRRTIGEVVLQLVVSIIPHVCLAPNAHVVVHKARQAMRYEDGLPGYDD